MTPAPFCTVYSNHMQSQITGIILAGGRASRLGRDKALEPIGGVPVLLRVVAALQTVADALVLVEAPDRARAPEGLPASIRRVTDVAPDFGPLAGLRAGLNACETDYALVAACDMPFLATGVLQRLVELAPGWDAVLPRWSGRPQFLCAAYGRSCLSAIDAQLAHPERRERSLVAMLQRVRVHHVDEREVRAVGGDDAAFTGINSEAEVAAAQGLAAARALQQVTQ